MTSTAHPVPARAGVGHLIATAFVVLVTLGTPALAASSLRWATGPGSAADHAMAWLLAGISVLLLAPITAVAVAAFVRGLRGHPAAHRTLGRCASAVGSRICVLVVPVAGRGTLIGAATVLAIAGTFFAAGAAIPRLLRQVR
jgi:hypothetical protein